MADPLAPPTPEDTRLAALAYAVGPVTGLLCLWLCPERPFPRFHAWQSTLLWVAVGLAIVGFDLIPIVGDGLAVGAFGAGAVLTAVLLWRAWRGDWLMLPLLGDVALEQASGRE